MKKHLCALTLCLALTSTVVYADAPKTTLQNKKPATVSLDAKKQAKSMTMPFKDVINANPQDQMAIREELRKKIEEKKQKEREFLYASLNFTEEQKAKAEALDKKTKEGAAKYIKQLQTEAKKMRELKAKKASKFALWRQKLALDSAKKDLDKYFKASRKEFESILNPEQKTKFDQIQEAKKQQRQLNRGKVQKHKRHGAKLSQ